MLVPLSWLKDFVDINLPIEAVDTLLTNAGLEVKATERIGIPGADLEWDPDLIRLSHLLQVAAHPDADKLVLATVDYGASEPKTVVTGAPNLFAYVGQGDISGLQIFSPLALEGAVLYDGHKVGKIKSKLKGRPLRGIYNDAMLCSEKELGVSEEHEGVILMRKTQWSPDYVAGTPLVDVLGDAVFEIDIIPNIARCASMLGVAREYAALTNQPLREPDYSVVQEGAPVNGRVIITTEAPELNPRFVGMLIEGVEQKPAPYWMQYRLRLAGQRPINVVVDVSNYVMLEMGQPNHTFDYDFMRGRADEYDPDGPVHVITRLPHAGDAVVTLDGQKRQPEPYTILVTDPKGYLSIGGIMGGLESEIQPGTKNVLLEAAAWNFINIRRSSTRMGIYSEAAFRFSRGVHPSQALLGALRAAELLRRHAGGTVAQGIVDYYPLPPEAVVIELDPVYVRRLSGLDLTPAEMADLLNRLQFDVEPYGDHLLVTVPDFRMDIEGPHDLVEEICRVYGYDNVPSTVIADTLPPQRGNPELEREERVRDLLVQLGLQEVITYRLTAPGKEAALLPPATTAGPDDRPYVTLSNPISAERMVLRHSVLSSVLEVVASNSRYQSRIALFEIGDVYLAAEDSILPDELARLAIALTGQRGRAGWQDHGRGARMDFYDLKGVVETLCERTGLAVTYAAAQHPSFRPGRTARVLLGAKQLGVFGELHPLVAEAYDIRLDKGQAVLAADLDLQAILAAAQDVRAFQPLSAYPAVREDLALVVDRSLSAADVATAVRAAGGFLLQDVELFDLYEGEQIPPGKKSLAYHLTFQAPNKTLTDKDVSKLRGRILAQLERQLGAELRA